MAMLIMTCVKMMRVVVVEVLAIASRISLHKEMKVYIPYKALLLHTYNEEESN